jgi:glucosyl-3-phosphoglycerate synthase
VIRSFGRGAFDPQRLARAKRAATVSVCLPARDEAATVGQIVDIICSELVQRIGLVDEVVVIDDGSTDDTAAVAAAAGARVERAAEVLSEFEGRSGKGDALWRSLHVANGDIVVWCDADITNFHPDFITGLLGPLLTNTDVGFVKGYYERPGTSAGEVGGRVTELVARPLISLFFPDLAPIVQPLSGEYGGRREVLEALRFVTGYGVDLGLLIDVTARFGLGALAQVDLGTRLHRNRPLDDLGPMALEVMQAVFSRAEVPFDQAVLVRPGVVPVDRAHVERPPLVDVPAYQARRRALAARQRTA